MKMKSLISKRILTMLLVIAMIMSLMPSVAATSSGSTQNESSLETQSTLPFTDVSDSKWYYEDVEYVYNNSIMIGTGNNKFEPETTVTRAQFVKAISNMAEKQGYTTTGYYASKMFKDVSPGAYYDQPMGWAKMNGILEGTGSNNAEPDVAVTREQMATFLYRYVEFLGYELADTEVLSYSDQNSISTWATFAVDALTKAGVFNGIYDKGTNTYLFKPQEASTRAQMAALLHRLLDGAMYPPTSPPPPNVLIVPDGQNYEVTGEEKYDEVTLGVNSTLSAADNGLLTLTVNGIETVLESGKTYSGDVVLKVTQKLAGDQGSLTTVNTGSYWPYRTALYFESNSGYIPEKSVPSAVMGLANVGTDSASNISVTATTPQFSAMIFNGPMNYTIKDSVFDMTTAADGSQDQVNDFSALGAAIGVYNGATVTLDNVNIHTTGVAKPSVVTDSANMMMKNSTFLVEGGTLYDGYQNTADMAKMVAPPWVLGIAGNARGTNLLGDKSVNVFLDSDLTANGWGVLSSDAGENGMISVINSDVKLTGNTGYGIYVIGNVNETYYGTNFDVATYAVIMTGGTSKFTSYTGGQSIDVVNYDGTTVFPNVVSEKVDEGTVVKSIVDSQFGVMSHNSGTVILEEDTVFNTKNAAFLIKDGMTTLDVKDSEINVEDGILIQVIDNDDRTVGADMSGGPPVFNKGFNEQEGWPTVTTSTDMRGGINATFTNVDLKGDMYNASGYQYREFESTEIKNADAKEMNITLGAGATLEGAISKARSMHVWMEWIEDKNDTQGGYYDYMRDEAGNYIQATEFSIDEYYNLGHVVNQPYAAAKGTAAVTLKDGAVWTVTGASYLTSLTIDSASNIVLPEDYRITVDGVAMTVDEIKAEGTVAGVIKIGEIGAGALTITDVTYKTVMGTAGDLTDNAKIVQEYTLQAKNGKVTIIDNSSDNVEQARTINGTESFTVPEGYYATLTIEGVEYGFMDKKGLAIDASSDVVITYTKDMYTITNFGPGAGAGITESFRAGVYVEDGVVIPESSVLTAAPYNATDSGIEGVSIISRADLFNGIMVKGTGGNTYTIENANLSLTGNGGDDFQGWGAGIMVYGDSDVEITKSYIEAEGAIRSAIWAGGNADLYVSETVIVGKDADTTSESFQNLKVPMMTKVPWALGLEGNNRITNVLGAATATYTDSIIVAEGWGALSSDSGRSTVNRPIDTIGLKGVDGVLSGIGYLEEAVEGKEYTATKEVNGVTYGFTVGKLGENSGYVTYADQGITNTYYNSEFYAPDYIGIIAAGTSGMTMENVAAESQRGAFMYHQTKGGTTTINGGSYRVADSMFIIKSQLSATSGSNSAYTDIVVNGAEIDIYGDNAQSGTLLMLIPTDDTAGSPVAGSYTAPYEGVDTVKSTESLTAVNASFNDVEVEGNIYNAMQYREQPLNVAFSGSTITGLITSSYDYHVDENGVQYAEGTRLDDTMEGAYLYGGRVVNVASPTVDNPVNLTLTNTTWNVTGTSYLTSLSIDSTSSIVPSDDYLLTMTVNGVETVIESGNTYSGEIVLKVTEKLAGDRGSLTTVNTSNYWPYRTALYFEDNTGYILSKSVPSAVMNLENVGTDSASGISITATTPQFSAMIFNGPLNYTVSDTVIDMTTTADGSQDQVNDFSALGAAIGVYNGATVTLDNVHIHTTGVAKPSVVTDSANMMMKNSTFLVEGGTLYEGYQNTADMSKMVAPPWVLGIAGNARGTNLLGQKSVNVFLDSDLTANGWGVLSSDSGQNGVISVINSDVKLAGNTGYGIYVIGNVNETYYGTNFDVATYAVIMTGGTSKFTSYTGGQSIDTVNYDGTNVFPNVVSEKVTEGTVVNSIVDSQFGVMSHNTGTVILEEDTVFNTKNAAFLIKDGTTTLNVEDSEINVEDGILIQVMDNDDSAVGADMIGGGPQFKKGYNEKEGWPTVSTSTRVSGGINATFTDIGLKGDMYNASGYQYSTFESTSVSNANPKSMSITLGEGATLEGVISKARSMHVWMEWIEDENDTQGGYYDYMLDEEGNYIQATLFSIDEYYNLGHVVNEPYADSNGTASVILKDGAVWTVTGTCYLTSLSIDEASSIVLPDYYEIVVNGAVMTVDEIKEVITVAGAIEIRALNVLVVEDGDNLRTLPPSRLPKATH